MAAYPKPKVVTLENTTINLDAIISVTKTKSRINGPLQEVILLRFNFLDAGGEPYKIFIEGPEAMAFYEWYAYTGMRF